MAFYLNTVVLEFYLGMLLAHACMKGAFIPRKVALALLPIGFLWLLLPPFGYTIPPTVIVSGLPAALIVWCVVSLEEIERFMPGIILYLGDASYAIYLIHPFVCPIPPALLHRLHSNIPWLAAFLSVAFGIGIGCLLHQFIERPIRTGLRRYLERKRPIPL